MDTAPQVSVVITRYREPDAQAEAAIAGVLAQAGAGGEVLYLDQMRAEEEAEEARGPWTLRRIPCAENGLSHARNLGVARAANDTVLFLDADAVPAPGWAAALAAALSAAGVAVAGGRILPAWPAGPRPGWTEARVIRDQLSIYDLGPGTRPVTRVVGAAFGLRRDRLPPGAPFDPALGRRDGRLFGGEESDLCARVRAAGGTVVYVGGAEVRHHIGAERLRLSWILNRLYHAGLGRARQGGAPSPSQRPGRTDWLYLPLILPPYALGYLRGRLSR